MYLAAIQPEISHSHQLEVRCLIVNCSLTHKYIPILSLSLSLSRVNVCYNIYADRRWNIGDSVTAVNLALLIQKQYNVSVPVHSLLTADASTVASLVNNARRTAKLDLSSSLSLSSSNQEELSSNMTMMLDMHLDDELQFVRPTDAGCRSITPRSVLITGATGFIGSHLVRHLLATLPSDTVIACLVRTSSPRNRQDSLSTLPQDSRIEIVQTISLSLSLSLSRSFTHNSTSLIGKRRPW